MGKSEANSGFPISKGKTLAEVADFWDTHDAVDFEAQTSEVEATFELQRRRHYIAIEPELLAALRGEAIARGISTESLANLWLQERLLRQG
ncbi:MAG: BrnA antitoxin family protein [Chloroflexi bacterium]|nr:BrnA antitoxin family protein [Chloroflexota bacterium]